MQNEEDTFDIADVKTDFKEEYLKNRDKARMFIFPLIGIKDRSYIENTYIGKDEDKLYVEVNTNDPAFNMNDIPNVEEISEASSGRMLITVDAGEYSKVLKHIRKGKYSKISKETKKMILNNTDEEDKDMIDSYLYPLTRMLGLVDNLAGNTDDGDEMLDILLNIRESLSIPRKDEIKNKNEI